MPLSFGTRLDVSWVRPAPCLLRATTRARNGESNMRQTSSRAGLISLMLGIAVVLSVGIIQAQLITDTAVMQFGALNKSPFAGPTPFDYHVVTPEEVTISKGETVT